MNKKNTYKLIGFLIFAVLVIIISTGGLSHNWTMSYDKEGKNPYDISIFHQIITENYNKLEFSGRLSEELSKVDGTYFYISSKAYYSDDDAWALKKWINSGGTAFVLCDNIPKNLKELFFYAEDCGFNGRTISSVSAHAISSNFLLPDLSKKTHNFSYYRNKMPKTYSWSYFNENIFCGSKKRAYPISKIASFTEGDKENSKTYFIKMKVGKGTAYFCLNPLVLTNLFLAEENGFDYLEKMLSLNKNKNIYIDYVSRFPESGKKERERPPLPAVTPLEYIFSQNSLKWSWLLLICFGIAFMLFRAKRRQRSIPVLEMNKNQSLEFIKTIGALYYQKRNHKDIIKKQMNIFLSFIRQRYNLKTHNNNKLRESLAVKSKVDLEIIEDIFNAYNTLMNKSEEEVNASDLKLNNFYLLIERFHKQAAK